jgi:molybdate transport system substrate-binding protein
LALVAWRRYLAVTVTRSIPKAFDRRKFTTMQTRRERGPARHHVCAAFLTLGLLSAGNQAHADDLTVMTAGGFASALRELAPRFERATHHTISVTAASTGAGPESIPNRVIRGDPVDVLILTDGLMRELIKAGYVVPESRRAIAGARIGVAVRAGADKPDISTVAALRRVLLAATSVAYSGGPSGMHLVNEVFPRLGISEEMKVKSVKIEREPVGAVVARGEAQIGFQQISELLPIAGIRYVGPLPPDIQLVTVLSAAVTSRAQSPNAARAFIHYLGSREVLRTFEKHGLEAPPRAVP